MYERTNCGNVLLAMLFDISEQTIYEIVYKMLPLLQDRFIPNLSLRKKRSRINTIDKLLKEYPELEEVIADGTDIVNRRPKRKQSKEFTAARASGTARRRCSS